MAGKDACMRCMKNALVCRQIERCWPAEMERCWWCWWSRRTRKRWSRSVPNAAGADADGFRQILCLLHPVGIEVSCSIRHRSTILETRVSVMPDILSVGDGLLVIVWCLARDEFEPILNN